MTVLGVKRNPLDLVSDPRCQPWAYITLDGRLLEVVRFEVAPALADGQSVPAPFLIVTDCSTDIEHRLPEDDIRSCELVRAAPDSAPSAL